MILPRKVLQKGIRDMVRASDTRMSGMAFGTVVLHTAPEAAAGGPLAIVQTGDFIELDVEGRTLHLDIPDAQIKSRLVAWQLSVPAPKDGYAQLYHEKVMGPDTGADFDFLVGCRGNDVARESY